MNSAHKLGHAMRQQHDAERMAQTMLAMGARTAFVTMATGLSTYKVRAWNRIVTGRKASQGPVPYHAASIIRTRIAQVRASLFGALAAQADAMKTREFSPELVIRAYERYLSLAPDHRALSINDALVIVRDLRNGSAVLEWCERCQVQYLDMADSHLRGCPICALYAVAPPGSRQRRFGR
jgi:hypothetical protein